MAKQRNCRPENESDFKSTLELQYPRTYEYEPQINIELRKRLKIKKHKIKKGPTRSRAKMSCSS